MEEELIEYAGFDALDIVYYTGEALMLRIANSIWIK
jgi:hypothetical protein